MEINDELLLSKQIPSYVFFKDYANFLYVLFTGNNSQWLHPWISFFYLFSLINVQAALLDHNRQHC